MRIGIDARTILNPLKGEAIGAGHYAYQLIRHLLEIDKKNEYILFFDFRVREKDVRKFTRSNVKVRFYPFSDYKKYLPGAYNEILGAATLNKEKLDVLHSTSALSRIPTVYRGKVITTFDDLAVFKIPECCSKIKRKKIKLTYELMAKKSVKIIAPSEATKKDIEKELGISSKKIKKIYSGLDKRFFAEPKEGTERVLRKNNIVKKYILFLGTLEPSKNITRLLQSFAEFKKKCLLEKKSVKKGRNKFEYQLVLAGKKGWLAKEYRQIAKDLKINKDIIFTGYIIGDELTPLFRNAEFFVMPSLYEGFGMTVLEAFASQTPAIISRVSSLPEIAGEAVRFVNPLDIQEIAGAMWEFSQDEQLRENYRRKGLEQAKKFDWRKTAEETLRVYEEVANI